MMPEPQFTRPKTIPDLATRLIELDYHPVPIEAGSKGPSIPGWQNLRLQVSDVPRYFDAAQVIGILHVNVACFDIDVYDPDLAAEIADEGFCRFPGALERIGQDPKTMLVMRLDEPGWKMHQTAKFARGDMTGQVDVRTVSRQFVAYGKHPETGRPYRWPRGELWATPRADLQPIERAAAEDYRDWCADKLARWADKTQATIIDIGDFRHSGIATDERPTEEHFLEALRHVPADLGHDSGWLSGLMAIHDFFGGSGRGLDVAKQWSSSDSRFNPREVEAKWRSFEAGRGVSYRTIFHLAKSYGADLSEMAQRHRQPTAFKIDAGTAAPAQSGQAEVAPINATDLFRPWQIIDPMAHPRRDFIYGKHYIRKFASVTVAPGGLGKSSLVLAECIAIATGRPILGIAPAKRERVVYFNAEDPREEIERRVLAICQHYQIDQSDLTDWFYFQSGRDLDLILSAGEDGRIIEPVFELMEKFAEVVKPGVFVFDPLANMTEAPETNDVFRRLGKRISHMADKLDCSVELVHHTRKLNGNEATVEDSRGGSALIGAVRAGRVLNPMTSDEAVKAGLETHIDHFRIEAAGKNNLSRGDERSTWLHRVDVEIANGEHVAAVAPWDWPDAFDGVTPDDAARVQGAIAAMTDDPPRHSVQSAKWAGFVVARVMDLDPEDKTAEARIKSLLKGWIRSGVLAVEKAKDTRNGRETSVVVAGPNNPKAQVSA